MSSYPVIQFIDSSKEYRIIQHESVKIQVCKFEILAHFSENESIKYFIVSLYEKSKGLFWWEPQDEKRDYLLSTSNQLDWFLQHWFIHVLDEK
ncbi:hypothetical protein PN36_12115 [Candidatus Thiomargarita nelsonii]|uniref:Uncharacterized protein n=1 Tax=Candidatus Thiomargarita nelsonii TaxID=1003181 RepID=A0A4E0RJ26_9GAMM|nr:hypothetical protein PN36_12115 [Candidatus Thiomargarita nelsonii]